jgi:hypothetical protein
MTTTDEVQLFAAGASAVAAIAAAVAAWRGPMAAAKLAEHLRQRSESASESRRIRLGILQSLMQERAALYSVEGVRALNLIDVAFAENKGVRDAWAELHQAFTPPLIPHVIDERTRKLLREIAADLGLSDQLRPDDLGRVYNPNAVQKQRLLEELKLDAALKEMAGQTAPAADGVASSLGNWPPKPT